jgi:hypothetical protein
MVRVFFASAPSFDALLASGFGFMLSTIYKILSGSC